MMFTGRGRRTAGGGVRLQSVIYEGKEKESSIGAFFCIKNRRPGQNGDAVNQSEEVIK